MALLSLTAGVCFVRMPAFEISSKVEQIEALGWKEVERDDPWVILFRKDVPEGERDPVAELRGVMGDYWMSAEHIRALLAPKS